MSLTNHIASKASPVRAFFVERLPLTGPVVKQACSQIRGELATAPLAASDGVDAGRAGMAVDYLFRFAIAPEPCPRHSPARLGAGMLGRKLSPSAVVAVDEALGFVDRIAPSRGRVTDDQWLALAHISLLFASYEGVYRSRLQPDAFKDLGSAPEGWRRWAEVVCRDAEVEDVAVLGWAAATDHGELRGADLICNPEFGQSRALGGADADLITDRGLLVDLKSTSTRRVCSRSDLWQLCGYALADTGDELGIRSVGLSLLRWRARVEWSLESLLEQLAGERVEVRVLRDDFAELLNRELAARLARRRAFKARHSTTDSG